MSFYSKKATLVWMGIVLLLFTFHLPATGQGLRAINGTVLDKQTGSPVSDATIFLLKAKTGTSTDDKGKFNLAVSMPSDSLVVSLVGYETRQFAVRDLSSPAIIEVAASAVDLNEVTIYSGQNPAIPIVKQMIAHKTQNDCNNLDAYRYQVYNRLEMDLTRVTDHFRNTKLMKPFAVAFNAAQVTDSGRVPLLMSESLSDYYYQKKPALKKEVIEASRISGVHNESSAQFLGTMFQRINVYDNYINLFGLSFISPLNNNALFFYKFYLLDSTTDAAGQTVYLLKFKPRRPSENTFEGTCSVSTTDFAITTISLRVNPRANINYVEAMQLTQQYAKVNEAVWMPSQESLVLDFKLPKQVVGVEGKKFTTYQQIEVNHPDFTKAFATRSNIDYSTHPFNTDDNFWASNRPVPLAPAERQVYSIIDSIQRTSAYHTYYTVFNTVGTGYLTTGKFEIGPFYNFYSTSTVEGSRFRFGGRTSNAFSNRLMLYGYGAYGLKDEAVKYNAGFLYMLNKTPRQTIGVDIKNDFEFSGNEFNNLGRDNIFASFFRRNVPQKFSKVNSAMIMYEKEWNTGFSSKISFQHKTVTPYFNYSFLNGTENLSLKNAPITFTEVSYSARFAYQEKFYSGNFLRTSVGSKYPIIQVDYSSGLNHVWNSQLKYQKVVLDLSGKIHLKPIGTTQFDLKAGRIFGTLPLPALFCSPGNETHYYNPLAFNNMNDYEFVTDRFASLYVTQHLGGFIFNKIPALNRLRWRSVLTGKLLWGEMSEANRRANQDNAFIVPSSMPYAEVGTGIENIFKVFRIDAVWRLNYLNEPNAIPFSVLGSMQFTF